MIDFDSKARDWDRNPVFQDRADKIAAAIAATIPLNSTMHALDYGCGTGLLSFPLKDVLGHITLKDSSAGMLEVLREKIAAQGVNNMTVRQADITSQSLPADRYDLIYTSMVLHHIPDTAAILASFHARLNPGGWLCVADLDREDGSFHGLEVDVIHGFERESLRQLAESAGYTGIRFDTVFEISKGPDNRAYPVFLMVAHKAQQTSRCGHDLTPPTPAARAALEAGLTLEERRVILNQGTEAPFCGGLAHREAGVYHCRLCDLPLFRADAKFKSGSGWPSFSEPIDPEHVRQLRDSSHGMTRTEIRCARCDGHLGHVFDDGPRPSGQRYCLNSVSLTFKAD